MPKMTRKEFIKFTTAVALELLLRNGEASAQVIEKKSGIPVIMYHNVTPKDSELTPEQFEMQMRVLNSLGFKTITSQEATNCLQRGELPRGRIILTIDDIANPQNYSIDRLTPTYQDWNKHMRPTLEKYGFTATLGVVTGNIPERNNNGWSWEEIRKLYRQGYEIASHSKTHDIRMNKGELPKEGFLREFQESSDEIKQKCGTAPIAYIWPFGAIYHERDAKGIYNVLYTVWEKGALIIKEQLISVPRYHPDLHKQEDDFTRTFGPYAELGTGGPIEKPPQNKFGRIRNPL